MNKLVDKQVRINLEPFKRSPYMIEAFEIAAIEQGWSETESALAISQTRDLSLDGKYDVLIHYCTTQHDDARCIQQDVVYMLHFLGHHSHYLCTKLVATWDEYDYSNYNALKRKATRCIKGVFAHFPETMKEEHKYDSGYVPEQYFDTLEAALEAVPVGQETTVNIYPLWITVP